MKSRRGNASKRREKRTNQRIGTPQKPRPPGNGLAWDDMIPKDHGVAPSWVENLEHEQMEMNLPWRCNPEGTIWQRDPSPRWRIREEWARASLSDRDSIMKYKLVMGPDSSLPGQDVHPSFSHHGDGDGYAATTATDIEQ